MLLQLNVTIEGDVNPSGVSVFVAVSVSGPGVSFSKLMVASWSVFHEGVYDII